MVNVGIPETIWKRSSKRDTKINYYWDMQNNEGEI